MKKVKKGIVALGVLAVSLISFNSCDFDNWGRTDIGPRLNNGEKIEEFSEITYSYRASSIDADMHRSYELHLLDSNLTVEIKDYDSVLLTKSVALTEEQEKDLIELVGNIGDTDEMELISESGSDAEAMVIINAGKPLMQLNWNTNETENVTKLKDYLKSTFGDFEALISSTITPAQPELSEVDSLVKE